MYSKRKIQNPKTFESDSNFFPLTSLLGGSTSSTDEEGNISRELWIFNEIDSIVAHDIVRDIHDINKHDDRQEILYKQEGHVYNRKPITLYISTPGGCVYQGFSIIAAMKSSKTPVNTVAIGPVMSMGIPILLTGIKRSCKPYATFMLHTISSAVKGTMAEIDIDVKETKRLYELIIDIIEETTTIPLEDLEGLLDKNVDFIFDEKYALTHSVISFVEGTNPFKVGDIIVNLENDLTTVTKLCGSWVEISWFDGIEILHKEYVNAGYLRHAEQKE